MLYLSRPDTGTKHIQGASLSAVVTRLETFEARVSQHQPGTRRGSTLVERPKRSFLDAVAQVRENEAREREVLQHGCTHTHTHTLKAAFIIKENSSSSRTGNLKYVRSILLNLPECTQGRNTVLKQRPAKQ